MTEAAAPLPSPKLGPMPKLYDTRVTKAIEILRALNTGKLEVPRDWSPHQHAARLIVKMCDDYLAARFVLMVASKIVAKASAASVATGNDPIPDVFQR